MEKVFDRIYRANWWRNGSGTGSLPHTTEPYRQLLQRYLQDHRIGRVLDIGCGDWQFSRLVEWGDTNYIGIDVVTSVIERNQQIYGRPGISFVHGDVLRDPLPGADMVIVKDVLQHWTNDAIGQLLERLRRFRQVLITNSTLAEVGPALPYMDLPSHGPYRPLDVRLPPFELPCCELLQYDARPTPEAEPDTKTVLLWIPGQ